ncbi:MAG: hypothetical protein COA67_03370 [Lutibacter sp.]|nr:MAG: hypothetical protein COA67_03370 [Lutibacter sp.]
MKKDIEIPKVTDVFMAIVKEYNSDFRCDDWNVYLINNKAIDLEVVLIVSRGYDDKDQTSIMRKKIECLPANSYAKIEFIQPELFKLNNEFKVTFFADNQLFEKTFLFAKGTIKDSSLRMIKEFDKKGIISK